MKKLFLAAFLGTAVTAFAQDTMQTNRSSNMDLSGRVAARDMTGDMTPPALPLMQTFVPPEVMSQAGSKYGKSLYAVTMLKVAGGTDAYQVMVLENQTPRFEWIGADGAVITDIYRLDTGAMTASMPMNTTGTTSPMNNANTQGNAARDTANRMNNSMNNNMNVARDSANMMNNTMNNNANAGRDSVNTMNNSMNNQRDTSMRRDTSNSMMNNPTMRADTSQRMRRDTGMRTGADTMTRGDSGSSMRRVKGSQEMMLSQKHYLPFGNTVSTALPMMKEKDLYRREEDPGC